MLANAHTPLLFLLLALQVNDEHGLREGDERDGEAGEDPGIDGLEVGGSGGVVEDVVAHGHDAQHRRDPKGYSTRNLVSSSVMENKPG